MPEAAKDKPSAPTWLIMQEGGSSLEWYAHMFNTHRDALAGQKDCEESTYYATAPIRIGNKLKRALLLVDGAEGELGELLNAAVVAAKEQE